MSEELKAQYQALEGLTKQAQELGLYDLTVINADAALEMIENPPEPNDKLMKILELR